MPIENSDRDTTWNITADNMTWTLTRNARITVEDMAGISENSYSGSTIRVLGDIEVSGMYAGVDINGSSSSLLVGEDSRIDARQALYGVHSAAAGADITNRGRIQGGESGLHSAIWSDVQNYGSMTGDTAMRFDGEGAQVYNYGTAEGSDYGIAARASGSYIENARDGEIVGGLEAIFLDGSGTAEIVNRGLIDGGAVAIETEDSVLSLRNTGRILGDVLLGAGEDTLDTRKGTIKGRVEGGDGSDTYTVGAGKVKIVEETGAGAGTLDEVRASASHKLSANVEVLTLTGRRDIDGAGNGAMNWIYGNDGDNRLSGGGGDDRIHALGGDDVLEGGAGSDHFFFTREGVDRVVDFADGLDLIGIKGVENQADFDALDIRQVKGDTVIRFGGADRIVIEDLLKSDFEFNDIALI